MLHEYDSHSGTSAFRYPLIVLSFWPKGSLFGCQEVNFLEIIGSHCAL